MVMSTTVYLLSKRNVTFFYIASVFSPDLTAKKSSDHKSAVV